MNNLPKKIAPSILSADFGRLSQEITAIEKGGADLVHVDIMDGHFVPNLTIGPMVVAAVRRNTNLPLDVHLMIEEPDKYIEQFSEAGASIITVHVEACNHLHRTVHFIKNKGHKVGISLNPATSLSTLECIISEVDMVLIMSVNPGFGGQKFIPQVLPKIRQLRKKISEEGLNISIEVDGGISLSNIQQVAEAGADIFVAGNAVFTTEDYGKTIGELKRLAESSEEK
ncbi:MAG: ribulose-phosphate 3-epimerase [Thermodesulfobacteriota bacterium]|nr:ribulose-phosphate 3-epimerase [Thermodesulfobacteriota bacterium]